MTLLVIDNYDSFTYNLVQLAGELGASPIIYRNDALSVTEAIGLRPAAILISPGPGVPRKAGISIPLVMAAAEHGIPLLGVCLGHQAIGEAFGGSILRAGRLMHGKTTSIRHNGEGLFEGISNPFVAMRYHSLVIAPESFPDKLEVTAWSGDREPGQEIMGLRHRELPIVGVQFHPESIATTAGRTLLQNFLRLAEVTTP
ncbi:MAG: aminodeoxychorismate/anthranilate synthase component II [Gemmatimonadota bacterium]